MTRWLALVGLVACGGGGSGARDGGTDGTAADAPDAGPPLVTVTETVNSTRFVVREHMLAAGEMQISGEPLAEAMGRDLGAYSRDLVPPDVYNDPALGLLWVDLPGFSTGIESYEYSKQPMNNLAFESGAGTSLVYASRVNPAGTRGAAAVALLAAHVQHFAAGSNALGSFVFAPGTYPAHNPAGNANPDGIGDPATNPLGWPGIWPTNHVFASFDPAIDATTSLALSCSISSDDNPSGAGGALLCADYECDATSLHLPDRAAQIESVITPGADGFSGWKYGLWVINYLQVMHDAGEAAVSTVADDLLAQVGTPGNTIVGLDDSGAPTAPGTYLGSSNIEGFQAQMFLLAIDARATDWLSILTTADGATLGGFASTAAALAYDEAGPLRWFPARITVTEAADVGSPFPVPSYALADAGSHLLDQLGLAMGFATAYALTDTANRDVGGAQPAIAYFDGDPFAADDGIADGEDTLHDRALAMLRVGVVNLDRLHADPATGILVDDVSFAGAVPTRGSTVSTISTAYALIGLRTVRRSLGSSLELYSNNTPDTSVTTTPLDRFPLHGADGVTFTGRLDALLRAQAALLYDHLTDAAGHALPGWDLAAGAPTSTADTLDAHAAAVRGLFAAYLATGDTKYRDRAIAVFDRMQAVFYDPDARVYADVPYPVTDVEYTPLRFALVQSSLRDMYELVATRPGNEARKPVIEERLGRLNKLVLNGWDDRDRDQHRTSFAECAIQTPTQFPSGGMQMAERTLTGEFGSEGEHIVNPFHTIDRDLDCVPEIDDAHLPSALADSITLHIAR
ncbi:MAG TPA: hypothetical protein VGM88_01940 [Kofleriaceae bacterium]